MPAEFGRFSMCTDDPDRHPAVERTRSCLSKQHCNAEWAVTQKMNELVEQFSQFDDPICVNAPTMSCRWSERIVKALMGKPSELPLINPDHATALIAHDPHPPTPSTSRSRRLPPLSLGRRWRHVHTADRRALAGIPAGGSTAQRAFVDSRGRT